MKQFSLVLVAVTLLAAVGTSLHSQAEKQNQAPSPARSRSSEMLDRWNDIGNKLVAMAKDFPEDKYDFKVQKDQRTFAQNLLHAAALDFVLIRRISGSNVGPDFGEGDNPSRDVFKTKDDVVKFVQEAVADGAQVIQQQGDAGLDNTSKFFGNRLAIADSRIVGHPEVRTRGLPINFPFGRDSIRIVKAPRSGLTEWALTPRSFDQLRQLPCLFSLQTAH